MQMERAHSDNPPQAGGASTTHPTGVPPLARNVGRGIEGADPAHRAGKGFYQALSASSVGLEFGISVAIGLAFGLFLDGKLGTTPWLMLLFLVVGFIAGFRGILRAVRRSDRWAAAEQAAAQPNANRGIRG